MDRENSCEGMQLFATKTKQINLIFSGSPVPASAKAVLDNYPGKSAAVRLSGSLPYHRHYSPPPINCPRQLCSARLVKRVCDQRRNKWRRTGWLLARAGYVSPCCKVMCLWYMCFCAEVFFLFSHCTPQWSIVWGLKKILLPFLM